MYKEELEKSLSPLAFCTLPLSNLPPRPISGLEHRQHGVSRHCPQKPLLWQSTSGGLFRSE